MKAEPTWLVPRKLTANLNLQNFSLAHYTMQMDSLLLANNPFGDEGATSISVSLHLIKLLTINKCNLSGAAVETLRSVNAGNGQASSRRLSGSFKRAEYFYMKVSLFQPAFKNLKQI